MKKTLAYLAGEAGALLGIFLSICFYYLLLLKFVGQIYAAGLFFTICLLMFAGVVYATVLFARLDATHPYPDLRMMFSPFFFLVSAIVLALGCLIHSDHVWG